MVDAAESQIAQDTLFTFLITLGNILFRCHHCCLEQRHSPPLTM